MLHRMACNLTKIRTFESYLLITLLINGFDRSRWVMASFYQWALLCAAVEWSQICTRVYVHTYCNVW